MFAILFIPLPEQYAIMHEAGFCVDAHIYIQVVLDLHAVTPVNAAETEAIICLQLLAYPV